MYKMIRRNRLSTFVSSTTAIAIFSAASTLSLHAQQSAGTAASLPSANFKAILAAPLNLSVPDDLSYSSSVGAAETANRRTLQLWWQRRESASSAPPLWSSPRLQRQHAQPRWLQQVDLCSRWRLHPARRRLSQLTSPQAGSFRSAGDETSTRRSALSFSSTTTTSACRAPRCTTQHNILNQYTDATGLDGNSHIWSFTLNPIVNYYTSDTFGAYVIGGVGFYHKTADFTVPAIGTYCDPFYGCYQYQANTSHRQVHQQLRRS